MVDDEDYGWLSEHKWSAGQTIWGQWYAHRRSNKHFVKMHRIILNAPDGLQVDHINGDGLDNRRSNLRLATSCQNNQNRRSILVGTTSKFKGVSWHPHGRWQARIRSGIKTYYLGSYDNEEAAARAYDVKARELFGEFARTNF